MEATIAKDNSEGSTASAAVLQPGDPSECEFHVTPIEEGLPSAVDDYGFFVITDEQAIAPPDEPNSEGRVRESAWWGYMAQEYSRAPPQRRKHETSGGDSLLLATCPATNGDVLRRRVLREVRKYIRRHLGLKYPQTRRVAWPFLAGCQPTLHRSDCIEVYEALVRAPIPAETNDVIQRDLNRTLPTHCLFKDARSVGQQSLERVLHAYCVMDPEVGYCQGMGFIVGVLLLHMPEAHAFWMFTQMMQGKQYAMRQLYINGFPLLQQFFVILRQLCRALMPVLSRHFEDEGVDVAFFASQWFLTLFAYQFPVQFVAKLWDVFLAEGWQIVFRVSICMLQMSEGQLLEEKMEGILMHLKTIHVGKDAENVLHLAMDVPVRDDDLRTALFGGY